MISPETLVLLENAMRNIGALLTASLVEGLALALGQLAGALDPAALTGQAPGRDLSAEIRQAVSPESLRVFEDLYVEQPEARAARDKLSQRIDQATADELLAILTRVDLGLPPLTEKLAPEALAAYLLLLQNGNEPLQEAVGLFAQRVQTLLEPRNAAELEETYSQNLSGVSGTQVSVHVDRASFGEGLEAAPIAREVESAFRQLSIWNDWKAERLKRVTRVVIVRAESPDDRGFVLEDGELTVMGSLELGPEGGISGMELASALEEQWRGEIAEERRALRGQREVSLGEGFTMEVSGLRLVAPIFDVISESDLRAFNWEPGLSLGLLLRRSDGNIVAFEADSSSLDTCTDDTGGDLLSSKLMVSDGAPGFGGFPKVSEDGRAASIEINVPSLPKPGAKSLRFGGTLCFRIGGPVAEHSATMKFEEGANLIVGPYSFTVNSTFEDEHTRDVTLVAQMSLSQVAYLQFKGPDGSEVHPMSISQSTMGWGDDVTEERTISFSRDGLPEKLTIVIGSWKSTQLVRLPFSTEISVGL